MTQIELGDTEGASGLMALVITVLELVLEAMEREAIRRMESGQLTAEEIEHLGSHLQSIEAEIADIKEREGIEDEVSQLRQDLDNIVNEAITHVQREEALEP